MAYVPGEDKEFRSEFNSAMIIMQRQDYIIKENIIPLFMDASRGIFVPTISSLFTALYSLYSELYRLMRKDDRIKWDKVFNDFWVKIKDNSISGDINPTVAMDMIWKMLQIHKELLLEQQKLGMGVFASPIVESPADKYLKSKNPPLKKEGEEE